MDQNCVTNMEKMSHIKPLISVIVPIYNIERYLGICIESIIAQTYTELGRHCQVVAWLDDDYWEYRRCCLDVDPVECIANIDFDYILTATVDPVLTAFIISRLENLGVERNRILTVTVPEEREELLEQFLDTDALLRRL